MVGGFSMFAQEQSALERSAGGLGIGLALAKGLVELHGGTITAASEGLGRGSRFVVKLPRSAAAAVASNARAAVTTNPLGSRTVLLADDNRDSIDSMAELLRLSGHVVYTAYEGLEAFDLAMRLRPDVLVLDIGMPGLNGYELAQRIRAQPWAAQALLVAATGWGQESDRRSAEEAGFDLHLTKPFNPDDLLEVIAKRPGRASEVAAVSAPADLVARLPGELVDAHLRRGDRARHAAELSRDGGEPHRAGQAASGNPDERTRCPIPLSGRCYKHHP